MSRMWTVESAYTALGRTITTLASRPPASATGRITVKLGDVMRGALLRLADPDVQYKFEGCTLTLPLSHDLPVIRRHTPSYGLNLAVVAALTGKRFPGLTAIDVGANVGDSVVLIRGQIDAPVLCIEGAPEFTRLLRANTVSLEDVEIEECFVGSPADGAGGWRVADEKGTARLVWADLPTPALTVRPFEEVIARHPRFREAKLLKIDTDGLDCQILLDAEHHLRRARPVVFFEYNVHLIAPGVPGAEVFPFLADLGYERAVIYDSIGTLWTVICLRDEDAIRAVHARYGPTREFEYCDVCAVHDDDAELLDLLGRSAFSA